MRHIARCAKPGIAESQDADFPFNDVQKTFSAIPGIQLHQQSIGEARAEEGTRMTQMTRIERIPSDYPCKSVQSVLSVFPLLSRLF
jgi:hypothetical protein